MPDIKTRQVIKGTIKTLDRSKVLQDKVKGNLTKMKNAAENSVTEENQAGAAGYAIDRISAAAEKVAAGSAAAFDKAGRWGVRETRENLIKVREKNAVSKQAATSAKAAAREKANAFSRSPAPAGISRSPKGIGRSAGTAANNARKTKQGTQQAKVFARTGRISIHAAGRTARNAAIAVRAAAKGIAAGAKAFAGGVKAIGAAIAAGGWVAVLVVMVVVVLGAAVTFFGNQEQTYMPVSEEVQQYDPLIRQYAAKHGLGDYVDLIKAVMMQESGGRGTDPMQASECGYNKKYPNTPGGITDPEYSIDAGIENLAACLSQAGVQNPFDIGNIKLALQGYNYGNGYIAWAKKKGGYTPANAREFSGMMAKRMGWSSYGDPEYASHVLRYYPYGSYAHGMLFFSGGMLGLPIEGMTQGDITSYFGNRASPGGIGSTNHKGIDIGFPKGTPIYSCESGTVTLAGWNGGYGKCVIISHGGGVETLYGHMSKINVAEGQTIMRGQCIGEVGSTGNSTGPHLHLGVKINGTFVDPLKGYLAVQ